MSYQKREEKDLKYRCLILDHDDTAVDSSAHIHYPAHMAVMKKIRPDVEPVSLEDWFKVNFHPGIMTYLTNDLAFNETELEIEFAIWREHNLSKVPRFFPGFMQLLREFKRRDGIVAVVSHSEVDIIEKHYRAATKEDEFAPDIIFGWSNDELKRKPNPYPVERILSKYGLKKEEALILDDLKPGVIMGRAAGVSVAGAGWAHQISEIESYMRKNCNHYFTTVRRFKDFILN